MPRAPEEEEPQVNTFLSAFSSPNAMICESPSETSIILTPALNFRLFNFQFHFLKLFFFGILILTKIFTRLGLDLVLDVFSPKCKVLLCRIFLMQSLVRMSLSQNLLFSPPHHLLPLSQMMIYPSLNHRLRLLVQFLRSLVVRNDFHLRNIYLPHLIIF